MIKIRKIRLIIIAFLSIFLLLVIHLNFGNSNYFAKKQKIESAAIDQTLTNLFKLKPEILKNISQNEKPIESQNEKPIESQNIDKNSAYINEISTSRINKLFRKLLAKENEYEPILKELNLIEFKKLISNSQSYNELNEYVTVKDNKEVVATDKLIKYLNEKSLYYSFQNPRNAIVKSKITNDEDKPVIVIAANSRYYSPLQATVYHVHQYYSDYKLIIYDLGLDESMLKSTKQKCKCEVRSFNKHGIYSKISPHVADLKVFSWKPIIISEVLKSYNSVLYIDTSIRFHTSEIKQITEACKDIGMLTQFIQLELLCYTNPKMFDWFEENPKDFSQFYTIEANILMFHKSFLTSLIMKAWVTCALDKDCIAPPGSSTGGCCGCHRYDQDAITIVNSFFYGHPKESKNYLPAYSFTTYESFFLR